jgi:hypothetical protein
LSHLATARVPDEPEPQPSASGRIVFYVVYLAVLGLLFAGAGELIVRAKGYAPWRPEEQGVGRIHVEPGGRFYQTHPVLGYSHIPGTFAVTIDRPPNVPAAAGEPQTFQFTATHLPNTLRITRPRDTYSRPAPAEDIWIFGCSFTHGWSINDQETYSWLLQERFPEYNVVNYGVSGYGTIHSLLQFREALKTKTPKIAVLAYAWFHDERNVFARTRQKAIAPYNRLGPLLQPYARLDDTGHLKYYVATAAYTPFPFMNYSALLHYVESRYTDRETFQLRGREVSQALILEIANVAREHNVKFAVATIDGRPMQDFYSSNGIASVDMAVDLRQRENTNEPFDFHPSALANRHYADTLGAFLAQELAPEER